MNKREILIEKIFDNKGTFEALHAAQSWCKENGFSFGPTCVCAPQAVLKGDWDIAKWRNLTPSERNDIDGTISGDGREGPMTVTIFKTIRTMSE